MKFKGQASIEYLIITGVLLVIVSTLILTSMSYFNSLKESVAIEKSELFVNSICGEIEYLQQYAINSGSKTTVYLPEGIDNENSFIKGKMININVYGSDINAKCIKTINGKLPTMEGKYEATLINRGNNIELSFS